MAARSERAGGLSEPIEIQEAIETADASGQPITVWKRVVKEWAGIDSVNKPEAFLADRTLNYKIKNFTIRDLSWLTHKHRIVYENEGYNIRSIARIERRGRNHFMEVLGEVIS